MWWKKLYEHSIPSKHNAYRPHMLERGWLLGFLAVTLTVEGFLVASLLARQSNETFLAAVVPAEIIALTNTERVDRNIQALKENKLLDAAASAKAADMVRRGYFSHIGPDEKQPWDWILGAGYDYEYAGENLAVRFVDSKDVVHAWMESPAHRANITKHVYTDIGVGVANGVYQGQDVTFVVQYFASPTTASNTSTGVSTEDGGAAVVLSDASRALSSMLQKLLRVVGTLASEPHSTANMVLVALAGFILLLLIIAFFTHIQIQATEMLLGGFMVASLAAGFAFTNTNFLSVQTETNNEAGVGAIFSDVHHSFVSDTASTTSR